MMTKLTDAYVEWANHNLKGDPNYNRPGARSLKMPSTLKITKIQDIDPGCDTRNSGSM